MKFTYEPSNGNDKDWFLRADGRLIGCVTPIDIAYIERTYDGPSIAPIIHVKHSELGLQYPDDLEKIKDVLQTLWTLS